MKPAAVRSLVLILFAAALCGCACTDFDHMSTTNWLDRKVVPENKIAQWIATPVLIPLAITTLAIDNFVVAPVVHLPSAVLDTKEWMTADVGGYYTEMGVLPFRLALAPVVLVGSEAARTAFAIDTVSGAAWGWPKWGELWVRDADGQLIGPRSEAPTGPGGVR